MFEGLISPVHLIFIFIVAMLVFGPKRLPDLGRSLGDGIKGFKEGLADPDEKTETTKKIEEKKEDQT